jgi:hypothetical protein
VSDAPTPTWTPTPSRTPTHTPPPRPGYSYLPLALRSFAPPWSSPTPTPGPCERYEPNNRKEEAFGPLMNGALLEAALCQGDLEDYYHFILPGAAQVRVDLDHLPNGTDYDLYLYRFGGGDDLGQSINKGTDPEQIAIVLEAGRYLIRVYPRGDARSPQPYRLSLSWRE